MIDILDIQNFQGHKDTCLDFHSGINIITGSSYTGKTSIIRALKWIINNRPVGDKFRSRWGGDTIIELHTSEHNRIDRMKTDDDNMYMINGKIFKALKGDVPIEIQKALNISDVNIQYQFDSPFLLSESTGEMARYLNKIIDLEKIDSSLSKVEQEKRKTKQEIEFINNQLQKLEEQRMKYNFIEEMEKDYIELDSYVKIIIEYGELRKNLFTLVKKYNDVTRKIEDHKKYNFSTADMIAIDRLHREKESTIKQRTDLRALLFKINDVTRKIEDNYNELIRLKNDFDMFMPEICPLCGNSFDMKESCPYLFDICCSCDKNGGKRDYRECPPNE